MLSPPALDAGSPGFEGTAAPDLIACGRNSAELGHRGACHTSRGIGFQDFPMDERANRGRLAGEQVAQWNGPELRNL